MAGHNKWSSIKHKKAKTDAQKGKAFTKVVREIVLAARNGGGDADMNPALRLALQKARQVNMPKDNIARAIEKGTGGGDGAELEEIVYEAYASGGVGLLIHVLTDNRNRSAANIRAIVDKAGGSMASPGAVSYQFDTLGVLLFDSESVTEEAVMEVVLEAGAQDIRLLEDGTIEVITDPADFLAVQDACDQASLSAEAASIEKVPQNPVALDAGQAESILNMVEQLEDDDDVQNVYGAYIVPDVGES